MKKLAVILAVMLCAFGVFASRKTLVANVVPFSVNFINSPVEDEETDVSVLGIGGEVLYKQGLRNNFFVETGVNSSVYKMKSDKENGKKAFSTTYAFLGAGYDINFTKVFTLSTHGDIGLETMFQDKEMTNRVAFKVGATAEFTINRHLGLSVGCDGLYSYAPGVKETHDSYNTYGRLATYRIIPTVGMLFNL